MIITVCVDFQLPIAQSLRLLARSLLSSLMYLFLKSHHQHSTLSLLRNITLFIVDCISHSGYPFLYTLFLFIDLLRCAVFSTFMIIANIFSVSVWFFPIWKSVLCNFVFAWYCPISWQLNSKANRFITKYLVCKSMGFQMWGMTASWSCNVKFNLHDFQ